MPLAIALVILFAVAATVTVAACRIRDGEEAAIPSDVASPTPTLTPEEEAARQALAAYDGFQEAFITAAAIPDSHYADLALYAVDPALAQAKFDLYMLGRDGVRYQGRPVWTARVTSVDLDATPATASLAVCTDITAWTVIRSADGSVANAPGQALRFSGTAQAVLDRAGRWMIRDERANRDTPC